MQTLHEPRNWDDALTVRELFSDLTLDLNLYPRLEVDKQIIEKYKKALDAGAVFPPANVGLFQGEKYVLDGWHRIGSSKLAGLTWNDWYNNLPEDNRKIFDELSVAERRIALQKMLVPLVDAEKAVKEKDVELEKVRHEANIAIEKARKEGYDESAQYHDLNGYSRGRADAEEEIERLQKEITGLKKPIVAIASYEELANAVIQQQDKLGELEAENKQLKEDIVKYNKNYNRSNAAFTQEIVDLRKSKAVLEGRLQQATQILDGTPKFESHGHYDGDGNYVCWDNHEKIEKELERLRATLNPTQPEQPKRMPVRAYLRCKTTNPNCSTCEFLKQCQQLNPTVTFPTAKQEKKR